MEQDIDIIRKLVAIEIIGQSDLDISKVATHDIKLIWNVLCRHRYKADQIGYTDSEVSELFGSDQIDGIPTLNAVKQINALLGGKYLVDAYRWSRYPSFELWLIYYTIETHKNICAWRNLPAEYIAYLSRPAEFDSEIRLSNLYLSYWYYDREYEKRYDISTREGVLGWIGFFTQFLLRRIVGYSHHDWLKKFFSDSFDTEFSGEIGFSNLMACVWYSDAAMREKLDIFNKEDAQKFIEWFKANKQEDLKKYDSCPEEKNPQEQTASSAVLPLEQSGQQELLNNIKGRETGGFNLVGWPRTEIGIGEDIRVAFESMSTQNIRTCIVNPVDIVPPSPEQKDTGYDSYISPTHRYNTDIVFLDSATQYRYYGYYMLYKSMPADKNIILVAPWELAKWPDNLSYIFDHVNVFWAATQFIYDAFEPFFRGKEISLAHPAVVIDEKAFDDFDVSRIDVPFVFLTTFDGLSSIHRKNPFATVKAFINAFPRDKFKDVKLIIKTMNFSPANTALKDLSDMIQSDSRIELINQALSRDELYGLIKRSHCFISLHRSEGFGRNIAELMLMNRPVIVSGYSGNVDFCFKDNSFLVEGELIPVEKGQYWNSAGQVWFDADIEHAAEQMKKVYNDRRLASQVSLKGRERISTYHSFEATGKRYRNLLEKYL